MNVTRLGEGAPGSDEILNNLVAKRDETHRLLESAKAAGDSALIATYEARMQEIAAQMDAVYAQDQEYFENPTHETENQKSSILPILAVAAAAYMVLK
jgi:hypothetical protein